MQTFGEESYIPYILMLFSLIYEKNQDLYQGPNIVITQNTIDRVFYIATGLKKLYEILEQKKEQLQSFYDNLEKSLQADKSYLLLKKEYNELGEDFEENLTTFLQQQVTQIQKTPALQHILVVMTIQNQEYNFAYYINVSKSRSKTEIGLFMLSNYGEEINMGIAQMLNKLTSKTVMFKMEQDFSRHNALYEYIEYTLPLWGHLVKNKQLTPIQAMSVLNFSMIPYYTVSQNLE